MPRLSSSILQLCAYFKKVQTSVTGLSYGRRRSGFSFLDYTCVLHNFVTLYGDGDGWEAVSDGYERFSHGYVCQWHFVGYFCHRHRTKNYTTSENTMVLVVIVQPGRGMYVKRYTPDSTCCSRRSKQWFGDFNMCSVLIIRNGASVWIWDIMFDSGRVDVDDVKPWFRLWLSPRCTCQSMSTTVRAFTNRKSLD